jgi:glutaredoxin
MKIVVLYTMKGCPFCSMIKDELNKEDIIYVERDIEEFDEEYQEFSETKQNEYVPAFMLLTIDDEDNATDIKLMAPEDDFNDIYDGVTKIKEYLSV